MLGGMEFIFVAIGVSMVVRAFKGGGGRRRDRELPPAVHTEDPRVAMLQSEVDDLRTQVERLAAAESFYAQLQAGPPATPPRAPPPAAPPPGGSPGGAG
jgi:hypothetical protein